MNILIFGQPVFQRELKELGHPVMTVGTSPDRDVVLCPGEFTIASAMDRLGGTFAPDVCLYVEEIGAERRLPLDMGNSPLPVAFYSIDTHLNFFWHAQLASVCDLVFTTQRDYVSHFERLGAAAHWLPWSFDPNEYGDRGHQRDLDIVFVGTVDDSRPRRKMLLERLAQRFSLRVFSPDPGQWYSPVEISDLFSRARVVINEAICGEINFRVFEAMSTGALLLTERIGNGLAELFEDGRHLVTYSPFDLFERAERYLGDEALRASVARAGKLLVNERHTRAVRAFELAEQLKSLAGCRQRQGGLGRTLFIMTRRGMLPDDPWLEKAGRILTSSCQETPDCGRSWLDLAEYHNSIGRTEEASACYAESWRRGERSSRLCLQWGELMARLGRSDEARKLFSLLGAMGLPGQLLEGLAGVLAGKLPSAPLYLWLARLAEQTPERYWPGYYAERHGQAPFCSVDLLKKGLALEPDSPELREELGDIQLRNGDYPGAANNFLAVICSGGAEARLYRKAAEALVHCYRYEDALMLADLACAADDSPVNRSLYLAICKWVNVDARVVATPLSPVWREQ